MATNGETAQRPVVIGSDDDFWRYSPGTGFDLTRPSHHDSPPVQPSVTIETASDPITVDPVKSALIVIDMQNFFLSPALGKTKGPGHDAVEQLKMNAVPACRKAGIRVIWVNWGLTEKDIIEMPPAIKKAFGRGALEHRNPHLFHKKTGIFGSDSMSNDQGQNADKSGGGYTGLGSDMGIVKDPQTGESIDAGKFLMRDQWNSALYPPLDKMYEEGTKLSSRPDVWIHKNRMSGMWGAQTELEQYLEKEGIKTLFFTGVNTDQCVGGTYQDSFSKGYDCVLLNDGCGTTSPQFAQQCIEWNSANVWGFAATCEQLAKGVAKMKTP